MSRSTWASPSSSRSCRRSALRAPRSTTVQVTRRAFTRSSRLAAPRPVARAARLPRPPPPVVAACVSRPTTRPRTRTRSPRARPLHAPRLARTRSSPRAAPSARMPTARSPTSRTRASICQASRTSGVSMATTRTSRSLRLWLRRLAWTLLPRAPAVKASRPRPARSAWMVALPRHRLDRQKS